MSPLCAAGTQVGQRRRQRARMVSITVGSGMLQSPPAARRLRAEHLPSGRTRSAGGRSPRSPAARAGSIALKATRAAARPPESPELIGPGTWSLISEKSTTILARRATSTLTLMRHCRVGRGRRCRGSFPPRRRRPGCCATASRVSALGRVPDGRSQAARSPCRSARRAPEAARAELAGGDLGAQVAQRRLGEAHVVVDDLLGAVVAACRRRRS